MMSLYHFGCLAMYVSVVTPVSSVFILNWWNGTSATDSADAQWWNICCTLKCSWLRNQTAKSLSPLKIL